MPIQQRLDRGLATMEWHILYPDTNIRHIVVEGFDHALFILSMEKARVWKGRSFMYDARWSKLQECRDLVVEEWMDKSNGSYVFRFCEKMKNLRRRLREWYMGKGKNSRKAIQQLQDEVRAVYQTMEFATDLVKQKKRNAHKNEEAYWKLKSRIQWLNEGGKNTKYHA